jgi:prepilin-type N-terminal cleavage/methylation domain-containing protein
LVRIGGPVATQTDRWQLECHRRVENWERLAMTMRRAFTLVELLVVIAIIGVLVALLLPAIQAARGAALRASCINNLKQLATAAHNYHDVHRVFPAGGLNWSTPPGQINPPKYRNVSLFVLMLPQLEQGPLSQQWDFNDPWQNVLSGRSATVLDVLVCPSDVLASKWAVDNNGRQFALTSYGGNGGVQSYPTASATLDGVFFMNSAIRIADILDGTSTTLLFGERFHRDYDYDLNAGTFTKMTGWGYWCPSSGAPGMGDVTLGTFVPINYRHPAGVAVNATYEGRRVTAMGSGHSGGCNAALADASTRFVSENIDPSLFRALSTRAGGETIDKF